MTDEALISKDAPSRKLPMRVLVLGLPRTNTSSLISALRTLGYHPYTMRSLVTDPTHIAVWQEAVHSTQHASGLPLPINDILSDYDAIADLPGCMFAEQLITAYPRARVVLTTRAYREWEKSMRESIWVLFTWRLFELCRLTGLSRMAPLIRLLHALFGVHNGNVYGGYETRRAYERHNERVRELVSREQLLEIDAEDESGWDELCGFLGEERPEVEYPRFKEETAMRAGLEQTWFSMARYLVLMVVLPGAVFIMGTALYTYADDLVAARDQWILAPLKGYLNS
ncbi:uncharacterized protein EKO05_0000786 [Ascochyta rabiei]|uniref:Uncharacterized protein n=1 Tax=Didymella rabiei TaxID=5454 RepID=A0A163CW37_DIDRA|nr:uncharacterized protein EKO05_0000786 [Ascochyta rabiei]KZM22733.1 hypothetical protein ST47_g6153 [Ascochyta rabiei]UPX10115.1 hypothetical protein EKO05_0000786 [Ascochyta rabiei]